MKPVNQFGIGVVFGAGLTLAGFLVARLGIFRGLGVAMEVAGVLIFLWVSWRLKQARTPGPDTHGAIASDLAIRARIRFFWFVAVGLVLGSVMVIPLLPYMMENYTPQLLYWVIPAQLVVVGLFLFWLRRRLFGSRFGQGEGRTSS